MKYAKSADGLIHLISAVMGEYTLCGDAWDGEDGDSDPDWSWVEYRPAPVTCPKCAEQIRQCRGVRIAADTAQGESE